MSQGDFLQASPTSKQGSTMLLQGNCALLHANETWAFSQHHMHRLNVFQMKCLEKICEVSLKDRLANERILGWCKTAKVSTTVSHRRLRCLSHMARMPGARLPKRLPYGQFWGRRGGGFIQAQSPHYTMLLRPNQVNLLYNNKSHIIVTPPLIYHIEADVANVIQ